MSLIYLLVLFLGIARFGDCENNNVYKTEGNYTLNASGFQKTRLSNIETSLENLFTNSNNEENMNYIFKEIFSNILKKIKPYINIFPGTQWCGKGDSAKRKNELGRFNNTDSCCRAHDNCPNYIEAGDIKINIMNNGIFTRSTCICDLELYNCLNKENSISLISIAVGKIYFNLLEPQCFECIDPTNGCNPNNKTNCEDHCAKYQWRDNPKF